VKGETTQPVARRARSGLSPAGALVRRYDRDRYLTALFAPRVQREGLFALYAFNAEIARVREAVSQPMLGQIRLQWWRDAIAAAYAGAPPRRHEAAAPLAAAIGRFGLSRAPLDRLVDARERDLDDRPPASLAALEDYAEASSAALVRLALEVLGVRGAAVEEAGRAIGIAYALAGLLRAMPFHARAGRRYIPEDVAAAAGLDPRDYAELRAGPALRRAAASLAAAAAAHLERARRRRRELPRAALAALLPAVVAERALVRLRQAGMNPFDPRLAAADPLLAWRLAAAMLRRRF
jgi:NADH dehydrogenase [ubiquinone] 1 alpha subcomplex assembly factor 6